MSELRSRGSLVSISAECPVLFLFIVRPVAVPEVGLLVGARVVIERIARIVAPAIVQERTWRIPATVTIMLAKLPSSIAGLDAKGLPSG